MFIMINIVTTLSNNESSSSSSSISEPMISDNKPNNRSKIGIQIYICIVAVLVIITFISFICTRMGKRRDHNRHNDDDDDDDSSLYGEDSIIIIEMVGIDQAALNAYPRLLYSEIKTSVHLKKGSTTTITTNGADGDEEGEGEDNIFNDKTTTCCAICLEEYEDDHVVRLLPDCCHFFHVKCVDPWLKLKPTCPVCRTSSNPIQHWRRTMSTTAVEAAEHSSPTTADQRV